MKRSIQDKLSRLVERYEEIAALLSSPEVISDQDRFRELSKEYARLESVAQDFRAWQAACVALAEAEEMAGDEDPQMRALGIDEALVQTQRVETLEQTLRQHLIPSDPLDESDLFLEIRAGTGGDEAALFAGDLFRMYLRYAEEHGFRVEVMSESHGEKGGYKEIISKVVGRGAYSHLKFESGVHRVQRVPETESQGRIHTSACTVAVLPDVEASEDISIDANDLRVDTYRASGAGGQHVNKTDSAVRLTHLPTGIVVECQDERSQHKNRARALALLKARLIAAERERAEREQAEKRRIQVGSGDRSERIRTYNFPQGRVTDHRVNLTLYKLDEILAGNLTPVIGVLQGEYQADLLAAIGAGGE